MNKSLPRRRFIRLLSGSLLLSVASAQRLRSPQPVKGRLLLPLVQSPPEGSALIPGAVQPLAPGERQAAPLPRLQLTGLPEVRRSEYASNGKIEAAHTVVLLPVNDLAPGRSAELAVEAVLSTFVARPSLSEVAVSVYRADAYGGFGGPAPLLTASVPRDRLSEFQRLLITDRGGYERAWINPDVLPPAQRPPSRELERTPIFVGSLAELAAQRVLQLAAQVFGGPRGGLFFHGNPLRSVAGLSFDDAPHPIYAPLLLDTLRRAGIKATFFCIGRNARAYPYYVRDFLAGGHEVGNHTFHHVRLPELPAATVEEELSECNEVLSGITGKPIIYFRPPGGRYSAETLTIARSLGLTTTFWTDDPADFNNPGQTVLEERLARNLRRGGIVLLHDNVLESLRVLPRFVEYAARSRVRLDTIGALAGG